MQLSMKLEDYFDALRGFEETPVSLELILEPFGFFYRSEEDMSLSAGVFMECLAAEYSPGEWVDPLDVASSAVELGYEAAIPFIEEAPWFMVRAAKRGAISMATI